MDNARSAAKRTQPNLPRSTRGRPRDNAPQGTGTPHHNNATPEHHGPLNHHLPAVAVMVGTSLCTTDAVENINTITGTVTGDGRSAPVDVATGCVPHGDMNAPRVD